MSEERNEPKYNIGQVLHTKDGRKIGNAIIVDWILYTDSEEYVYSIITDFGNRIALTSESIDEIFHVRPGKIEDPNIRLQDQLEKLKGLKDEQR